MLAVVKYGPNPGNVDLLDIDEPTCGSFDVKIEIKASSICATDLHIVSGSYPWKTGVPLGHEFCGIVVEKGNSVEKFSVGDRVVACMDGGFAKYVVKNENDWVFPLPDEISYEEGALLEPFCAAANSVINRSHFLPNDVVLIEGPGVLGLSVLQTAKLCGAIAVITGTASSKDRLELAKKMGADYAVDVANEDLDGVVSTITRGIGVDVVYECAGNQASLDTGIRLLKTGGTLVQVGIFEKKPTLDLTHLVYHSKTVVGSIGYDRETWVRCIQLAKEGKICLNQLATHKLPLSDWKKGFDITRRKEGLRVILVP